MNRVSNVLLLLICLVFTLRETLAKQHSVTWDESTDYDSWASAQTFKVGDQIEFKYSPGLHSVVELSSEKEYSSCDIGNALDSMSAGNDVVKLNKAGTRYFACGTAGHCGQGMKLKVKTVATNESTSQDSPSSSKQPSSSSSSSAPPSHGFVKFVTLTVVLALGISFGLLN